MDKREYHSKAAAFKESPEDLKALADLSSRLDAIRAEVPKPTKASLRAALEAALVRERFFDPKRDGTIVVTVGRGTRQYWLEDIQDDIAFLTDPSAHSYRVKAARLKIHTQPTTGVSQVDRAEVEE